MFESSLIFSTYLAFQIGTFPNLNPATQLIGSWRKFNSASTIAIERNGTIIVDHKISSRKGSVFPCGKGSATLCIYGFDNFLMWQCSYDVILSTSEQSAFFSLVKGSESCSLSGMFEKTDERIDRMPLGIFQR